MSSTSGECSEKPHSKSFSKGEGKPSEDHFDDLNPIITYRQFLSNNLGVRDPLRVVALCDGDAFYAACERVRLDIDPALPLVVQQWDSLIAVNYPARKFGISRMDKVRDAKQRCPNLLVVHVATYKAGESEPGYWDNPDTKTHKVSLDHYRRESMKIIQLFKEGLPGGEVEKASIDEAFIDLTRPVREELLNRYPYLATVPPDAPNGVDSPLPPPPSVSWEGCGTVVPVQPPKPTPEDKEDATGGDGDTPAGDNGVYSPSGHEDADVEVDVDNGVLEDDVYTTWHDVALSIAAEIMMRIREDIRAKLGYTMSAGLARNKFLAKLTASYKKPDNQTILRNAAIPNYLRPVPFQKIRFLGGKLGKALAEEYDVSTVGDLLTISLEEMQRKFGEYSIWVYEILRGIDRSEVKEKPAINRSMLASKNLPQPITKASEGQHWIRVLAADLALRLNDARDSNPALWPKTIALHIRQSYETGRSKQIPFPFTRSFTVDVIASFGDKLWKELVGTSGSTPFKITNLSLSLSGIGTMEAGQRTIEGFLTTRSKLDDESSAVPRTTDVTKPPSKRLRPSETGTHSNDEDKRKRPKTTSHDSSDHGTARTVMKQVDHPDPSSDSPPDERWSFFCDKCCTRIWSSALTSLRTRSDVTNDADGGSGTSAPLAPMHGPILDDGIREDALVALRLEHADWHFAQEVAAGLESPRRVIRPSDRPASSTAKKTRKTQMKGAGEGIAKFFLKK